MSGPYLTTIRCNVTTIISSAGSVEPGRRGRREGFSFPRRAAPRTSDWPRAAPAQPSGTTSFMAAVPSREPDRDRKQGAVARHQPKELTMTDAANGLRLAMRRNGARGRVSHTVLQPSEAELLEAEAEQQRAEAAELTAEAERKKARARRAKATKDGRIETAQASSSMADQQAAGISPETRKQVAAATRAEERERVAAVFASEHFAGREQAAGRLLAVSDMDAAAICATIATFPRADAEAQADAEFRAAMMRTMDGSENPKLGLDDGGHEHADRNHGWSKAVARTNARFGPSATAHQQLT